jgi:hypothetical protein
MAQINFPVATADGQVFEAPTGVVYTYVGTPPNGYWSGTFQSPVLTDFDTRYLKLDASNDPITGDLDVQSNVSIGAANTSDVRLSLGNAATGDRASYIDLVGDTTYQAYGVRFVRNPSVNGTSALLHRGTGNFTFGAQESAPILYITNNTERMRIKGNGVINFASCPTYADDSAAGTGGLVAGDIYKTSAGDLKIKL